MEHDPLSWILLHAPAFLLVLVRIGSLLFLMPVFASKIIPGQVKAGAAMVAAFLITPFVPVSPGDFPDDISGLFFLVLAELLVGLTLSVMVRMVFAGLQTAAQIAGFQMGFSVASVMDPMSGAQSLILAEFVYFVAIVLFLAADGHHALIRTLHGSFAILPVGKITLNPSLPALVLEITGGLFVLSVKLMAPVLAILLFAQVALGILAKAVPQMNVIMVSFHVNIALGLIFFGLSLQVFWPVFGRALDRVTRLTPVALKMFAGS